MSLQYNCEIRNIYCSETLIPPGFKGALENLERGKNLLNILKNNDEYYIFKSNQDIYSFYPNITNEKWKRRGVKSSVMDIWRELTDRLKNTIFFLKLRTSEK